MHDTDNYQDSSGLTTVGQTELKFSLPDRINAAHRDCLASAKTAIEQAIEVGRLLIEAKADVSHGEWLPWIRENCEFSERTAQNYLRLAKQHLESPDPQRVTDLSIRRALQELRSTDEDSAAPVARNGLLSQPREQLVEFYFRHWWNDWAVCVLLLNADGQPFDEIADRLGCSIARVERLINPRRIERFRFDFDGSGDSNRETTIFGDLITKDLYYRDVEVEYSKILIHVISKAIAAVPFNPLENADEIVVTRLEFQQKQLQSRVSHLLQGDFPLFVIGDVYPDLIDPLAYRLTVQDDAWWAIDAEPLPCRGEDQRHFDDRKRALLINLFHWNEVVEQVREIKATSKSDDAGFQEGTSL